MKERVRFRNLTEELGKESIVLLSTHIVSDVEHIADEELFMKDGQLIYSGKWDENEENISLEDFYLKQFGNRDIEKPLGEDWSGRKKRQMEETQFGEEQR